MVLTYIIIKFRVSAFVCVTAGDEFQNLELLGFLEPGLV